MSGGNIVSMSQLLMQSRQKTFSIALSRDMLPYAHIVVYAIPPSGEVITDSLDFHVDGLSADVFITFFYDFPNCVIIYYV